MSPHQAGFITYHRGRVTILDRAGLEAAVCECYGVVKTELDPLFPRCRGLQLTLCADSGIGVSSIGADGWARDGGRDG